MMDPRDEDILNQIDIISKAIGKTMKMLADEAEKENQKVESAKAEKGPYNCSIRVRVSQEEYDRILDWCDRHRISVSEFMVMAAYYCMEEE